MAQEPLSTFHEHLLLFLQEDLQNKKNVEGWDEGVDPEMRSLRDSLSRAIRTAEPLFLQEIVDRYQALSKRGPVHLELKILEAFSDREMKYLGLPPLHIIRGLPRWVRKDQPAYSKLKRNFSHLPSLKRTALTKTLYSLYGSRPVPKDARISLLTWVISDGWGDYTAAEETAILIQKAFPFLEIHRFVITEQEWQGSGVEKWNSSSEQLKLLRGCDLILQIPTVHPKAEEWRREIEAIDDPRPLPKWESVGQYGFLESESFHPITRAHCMGLHFLEKGILIRSPRVFSLAELENDLLKNWLSTNRFFLAYLYSQPGIFVYLHALFKWLEEDEQDVDICFPDAAKLFVYLAQRHNEGKGPLEKNYRIRRILIQTSEGFTSLPLEHTGKTVRFLCPGRMSAFDFQCLLNLSEDFAACRGDQSFSEAVSQNKGFFYDPRDHSRYFVKDWIALAENRIHIHRSTVEILRLFSKVLEQNISAEEGEWVDEIALQRQEPMSLLEIAETMGIYLSDPNTLAGFKKLNQILREETNCNSFLIHLVQRAICHRREPRLAVLEEEEVERFIYHQQSLSNLVEHLRAALNSG